MHLIIRYNLYQFVYLHEHVCLTSVYSIVCVISMGENQDEGKKNLDSQHDLVSFIFVSSEWLEVERNFVK